MATNNPEGAAPKRKRTVTADVLDSNSTNGMKLPSAGTPRRTTVRKATPAKPKKATSASTTPNPKKPKKVAETQQVSFVTPVPTPASSSFAPGAPSGPSAPFDEREAVAESFIKHEVIRARRNLRYTQIVGTVVTLVGAVSLFTITNGFANNLQPASAANIAQGIISDHLEDEIPQIQQELREQIPAEIAKVPDYAKEQLPKYRQTLENQLEKSIQDYATQTAPKLSAQVDSFLANNKDAVRSMIQDGGSTQDTTDLGQNMKQMFVDYLNTTSIGGETLKSKVDSTLSDLGSIDARVAKMAANKNLTDNEKRGRRAIAILLRSVDENPQLQQAAEAIRNIDTTPVTGALQWKSQDEAVFTAPGKTPMVFVRKKDTAPGTPATTHSGTPLAVPKSAPGKVTGKK